MMRFSGLLDYKMPSLKTKERLRDVANHMSQAVLQQLAECTEFRPLKQDELSWLRIESTYWPINETGRRCRCGRFEADHAAGTPRAVSGLLQFVDEGDSQRHIGDACWYARVRGIDNPDCGPSVIKQIVDKETYFKAIADLMFGRHLWNMPKPQLFIDVIGSHWDLLGADDRMISKFYEAITRAAVRADAWIVTNGIHAGVTKLVGHACTKRRRLGDNITCLGIAPFGILDNSESLETPQQLSPNHYRIRCNERLGSLNAGHNYFLLIDNGTKDIFGEEMIYRTDFIDYLCQTYLMQDEAKGLPYVMLLVGGSFRVIASVERCVTGDVKNPVILLTGFGGVADLLSYALTIRHPDTNTDASSDHNNDHIAHHHHVDDAAFSKLIRNHKTFKKLLASMKSNDADHLNESDITKFVASIKTCVEDDNLIRIVSIFDEEQMNNLDKQLLEAIFDSEKFDDLRMLTLAQQWDRSDIAECILKEAAETISRNSKTYMTAIKLMISAIENGQWDFFSLLKTFRLIRPDEMLTTSRMKHHIYLHIYDFLKDSEKKKTKQGRIYRDVARALGFSGIEPGNPLTPEDSGKRLTEVPERVATFEKIGLKLAKHLHCLLSNPFEERQYFLRRATIFAKNETGELDVDSFETRYNTHYITKYRDIFLLELMMNHHDFAINIWRDGRELIGSALMASIFLQSLSRKADKRNLTDLAEIYKENAIEWQERAKAVMATCHRDHPDFTQKLLKRRLQTWQDRTVLEMCDYGFLKSFVAQPSVQLSMTQIWYGRIASLTSSVHVLLAAICPLFIFTIKFVPSECRHHAGEVDDDLTPIEKWKPYSPKVTKPSTWLPALVHLHSSPICRAFVHGGFFLLYLTMFTWFILKGRLDESISTAEIVLLAWSVCVLIDMAHESFGQDVCLLRKSNMPTKDAIRPFLREVLPRFNAVNWNQADFHFCILPTCFFTMLVVSVITRFAVPHYYFVVPKTTYALACFILWARTFHFFILSKTMGVIVVTLMQMLPTIIYYLLIYFLLLLTFSWPIYALMHPDRTMDKAVVFFDLALQVVYNRFWNLFFIGFDKNKEEVEGTCSVLYLPQYNNSSVNSTLTSSIGLQENDNDEERCSQRNIVAILLFMAYIFCTNVAWMNMLIANLTAIVEKTLDNSIKVSQFNYFVGVRSVYYRSYLPAPINIIEYFLDLLELIYRCITGAKIKVKQSEMQEDVTDSGHELLDDIEKDAADKVLEHELKTAEI